MLKNLIKGVLKMLNKLKNLFSGSSKSKTRNSRFPTSDVVKQHNVPTTSKKKTHAERLARFKSRQRSKQLPIITNVSYSRSYVRFQTLKDHKQYQHELVLNGQRLTEDGVIDVQQPYYKTKYQSLSEYNRYATGYRYKHRQ